MPLPQFSAEQVRLLGQLLVPMLKDALDPELDRLRAEMKLMQEQVNDELRSHECRLSALEEIRSRFMAIWGCLWGLISVAGGSLFQIIRNWLLHK